MGDRIERFNASDPCPICGGWESLPRGQGKRCTGFWSEDRTYAHCSREELAGGLKFNTKSLTFAHRMKGQCYCGETHGQADHLPKHRPHGQPVQTYDYVDESGKLVFQACRYSPKAFNQRRPDGQGGWTYDLKGVRRVLYRLPHLMEAPPDQPVYIVEGEKDADRLGSLGLVATCNPMGAGKWRPEYTHALADRDVVILPDNDEVGRDHAAAVAASVARVALSVKVIDLSRWCEPLTIPPLLEHGDVSDWLEHGGTREDLEWIEDRTEPITPEEAAEAAPPSAGSEAVLVRMADVVARPVVWLWDQRFVSGGLSLIFGDPDAGKSFLTVAMAATTSRGAPWPDCPGVSREPGSVILLSAEDSLATTVRPRLEAAGADLERVHALTTMRGPDGKLQPFTLRNDVPGLEAALSLVGNVRLLVIDPVSSYLGGADEHKNAEIREVIGPLSELAERYNVAVVLVTHLNKGTGPKALYRSTGSLAFVAAARMAWMLCKDRDDPKRRLLLPAKANIAPDPTGIAFKISNDIDERGVVLWETDPIRMWADDSLAAERNGGRDEAIRKGLDSKQREAVKWAAERLAKGPERHRDTRKASEEAGIKTSTFYRALDELGVERFEVDGRKMLRLPGPELPGVGDEEGTF